MKLISSADEDTKDGELVKPQNVKELGICELAASGVKFSPSGRYFAVQSENDFIIYTYPKYQNTAFGQATDLVWSTDKASENNHTYACRTDNGTVKVYQNFQEFKAFKTAFANEGLYGGRLLAIKNKDFITFYDWEEYRVVRRIDVNSQVKHVIWSDDGTYLIIALEESFYLLKYNSAFVNEQFNTREMTDEEQEDGLEDAFTFIDEYNEVVHSGHWVSNECFVLINARGSINYLIGGRIMKFGQANKKAFILGYDSKQSRLYLVDKSLNIHAHRLLMSVIQFQNAVLN